MIGSIPPTHGNSIVDNITTTVAVPAVFTPFWLPWLQTVSQGAALVVPIVGLVWLLVQIWAKICEVRNLKHRKDKDGRR